MDKDLKEYMIEHGKEAEEITEALGYDLMSDAGSRITCAYLSLITRHSYYLREEMAAKKKMCEFNTAK